MIVAQALVRQLCGGCGTQERGAGVTCETPNTRCGCATSYYMCLGVNCSSQSDYRCTTGKHMQELEED